MKSFLTDGKNTPPMLRPIYVKAFMKTLDMPTLERAMEAGRLAVISITEDHDNAAHYNPDVKYRYYEDEEVFLMGLMTESELEKWLAENPGYDDGVAA